MQKRFKLWWLGLVLVLASFLRLYNLESAQQFLGDQGRDVLIVAKIFKELDPVFIGPVTSIGNMYLGPLYYYFMAPWLWLSYPSPIGPAIAVAVLGILTVWLMYKLGRELVGEVPAMVATSLYAVSAVVIQLTRFSWNPNPAPLFGLLIIYSLSRVWKGDHKHWLWLGLWVSIILQLHYLILLAVVAIGLVWLWLMYRNKTKLTRFRQLKYTSGAALIVLLSFLPLVLFDLKHNGLNIQAFSKLVFSNEGMHHGETQSIFGYLTRVLWEIHGRTMGILFELFVGKLRWLNTVLIGVFGFGVYKWREQNKQSKSLMTGLLMILILLGVGIIGTSFYGHSIFSHYISYLFPAVFLVYGLVIVGLWNWSVIGKLASVGFLSLFVWFNATTINLKPAGWQIKDIQATAETIASRVGEAEEYAMVLISPSGDLHGMNYKYFLYTLDREPLSFENITQADTLFVINEMDEPLDLESSPVNEIMVFPNKTPEEVYRIPGGPEITVLRK
jgi:4-amino-4-deoxy-L-arabinose transferase-like glycosyltransferase